MAGLLVAMSAAGCALAGEPEGPFADLRGTWTFAGSQSAPVLQLSGTLVFSGQDAEQVVGSLSWQETDRLGIVVTRGGPTTGTVVGLTDVDFAVTLPDGERRFVAEVRADTLVGVWAGAPASASGEFRAERVR
ncbi:hypothetical protein Strain138_001232 [Pseudogemmatithrix spongiicola]|uniref:Lipocalin-like domain-containing protein n=1 Tax=Pseudogemmatithrix spongiicola TaxID=3062599 RepID=A0AA49JZM1_9BACT|nr:hypothetical protein Strain138_001232 [Gemmatimonadaceae bacterium 'strain 138']WKW14871.1 hypothetical protein Strain318_001232 [Gemmatimonadaceae bacterium 'strain 318']